MMDATTAFSRDKGSETFILCIVVPLYIIDKATTGWFTEASDPSMKSLFHFLKSLKLTTLVLTALAITSLFATLVPQGLSPEHYRTLVPGWILPLFSFLDYGNFFTSPLFLTLVIFFGINLGTCTLHRLVIQWGKPRKNWGPDILHGGLLLLLVASLVTAFGRRDATLALAAGMKLPLPGGQTMEILEVSYSTYEDGRPKEWLTAGQVKGPGSSTPFSIRVNQPLSAGGLTFYQYSYEEKWVAVLESPQGKLVMPEGTSELWEGRHLVFQGPVTRVDSGTLETGAGMVFDSEALGMAPGDRWEDLVLEEVEVKPISLLKASVDPGFPWAATAFLLCILGMVIIVIHKMKEI